MIPWKTVPMGFGWTQSPDPTFNNKLNSVIHDFTMPSMDCDKSDGLGIEASSPLQNRASAAAQAVQSTLDFLFIFSTTSLHGSLNQNLLLRPEGVLRLLTPMECLLPTDSKQEIYCSSLWLPNNQASGKSQLFVVSGERKRHLVSLFPKEICLSLWAVERSQQRYQAFRWI